MPEWEVYRTKAHGPASLSKGGRVGIWAPAQWGLGEIVGLLMPPGKASNHRPSDYWLTAQV